MRRKSETSDGQNEILQGELPVVLLLNLKGNNDYKRWN
jgi:hypothetical protein